MEATKKKKAYLKPEMTKFEMSTEGVMVSTSRPEINEGTEVPFYCLTISQNAWTEGGSWSDIKNGTKNEVYTILSNLDKKYAEEIYKAGFNNSDYVSIKRAEQECTATEGGVSIVITLIDRPGIN